MRSRRATGPESRQFLFGDCLINVLVILANANARRDEFLATRRRSQDVNDAYRFIIVGDFNPSLDRSKLVAEKIRKSKTWCLHANACSCQFTGFTGRFPAICSPYLNKLILRFARKANNFCPIQFKKAFEMKQSFLAFLALSSSALAAGPAISQTTALTVEQTTAFNTAVAEFTAGQKAQQGGDNATALTKYEGALPAIRDAVKVQPDNLDNVKFLANVLYVAAIAKASTQSFDAATPLLGESLPHWRTLVAAGQTDAQSRTVFATILTQLGNAKLGKQDKVGALPLYSEAIGLARKAVSERPDEANKNLLLGALIGASQAGEDPAIKTEVAAMSKAMLNDGIVNAANKPAAEILATQAL